MPARPMNRRQKRRIAVVIVATQVVLALLTGTAVYAFYSRIDGNIRSGNAMHHVVTKPRVTGPTGPLDILVMGTDTRDCAGCGIDDEQGSGGSDTTILVHISADRKTVYGISIPRDALVKPVACTQDHLYVNPDGVPTSYVEWNEAFAVGGPSCTAAQVERNFGVYVDDYVVVNFGGFKDMVDAVGGVDVCIPEELYDPAYQPHDFKPGEHVHLGGAVALQYFRMRHGGPALDGSDTGRIKRQQYFISRLIDKVFSGDTLSDPVKLYKFANAFTKSIETNPQLASTSALIGLARQLAHVDLSHIRFITVPSADYPTDSVYYDRVRILPAAKTLMKRVDEDEPLGRFGKGAQHAGRSEPTSAARRQELLRYGLCS